MSVTGQRRSDLVQTQGRVLKYVTGPLRTALFVDFDNIYRALGGPDHTTDQNKKQSIDAYTFATQPQKWLAWIEHGMPCQAENSSDHTQQHRSILVRRCYLNPQYGRHRYRPYFTRTAFSVVDCPTLAHEKNSADIHMVMDMLDALEHPTYFDEFIIFSGDSDFMPVLLRLRAHNRCTTILTIGQTVNAYQAAADHVIDAETFRNDAINFDSCQQKPALAIATPMSAQNGVT